MRTLLLYNPVAGPNRSHRDHTVQAIADLLSAHGYTTSIDATRSAGSAAEQVRAALNHGTELILSCGGDGTLHDVLQGLIDPNQSAPRGKLGVIPMGSANALARHLGLSMDPIAAARQLLHFTPRSIPVGLIECAAASRYFTVMAGAGPDGALVYRMRPETKRRMGRLAYYLRSASLFAMRPFPAFTLNWVDPQTSQPQTCKAVGTMAVRISDLGGLFSRLAPAGAVHHEHLHVVVVRPPAWLALPAWFASGWLRLARRNPLLLHLEAAELSITPADGSPGIPLQADGEWIGTAPARIRILPDAIRLLMPAIEVQAQSGP